MLTTVTVLHYAYRWHRYHYIMSLIKRTDRYRHKKAQLMSTKSNSSYNNKKKTKKQKAAVVSSDSGGKDDDVEPEIKLVGVAPPGFWDLVPVRMVAAPFRVSKFVYELTRDYVLYRVLKRPPPQVDIREIMKQKLEMNDEELDDYIRRSREKYERKTGYRLRKY